MAFITQSSSNNPSKQSSLHSTSTTPNPHKQTPSSSSSTPISNITSGPWLNYKYPSKWEISDDFMCVHFIPKTADRATWKSQCLFWNEAISLYGQQLLYECPYKYNRLTFTPLDIQRVYTRKNRLIPMCIIDIIKWMKYKKNRIIFVNELEKNYINISDNKMDINNDNNTSLLSISGVTSMVNSMFEYFTSNTNSDNEYDSEFEIDIKIENNINDNTKCIYIPIIDELCEQMSHINFYKKTYGNNINLLELIEIGIINMNNNSDNEFIINGLVFHRFCIELLQLSIFDINILKKYLILNGKIKLFYLNDEINMDFNNLCFTTEINEIICNNLHDLKNEMIYFCNDFNNIQITKEKINKMQLLSINLTMKHLKFQKNENENNLNNLNNKILCQLKNIPSEKRKEFMKSNIILFKRKKLLKKRISNLDGSIYNLETTLHSMEDMNINKLVFNEMKNADRVLKDIIKQTPNINKINNTFENIKQSIQINNEMSNIISKSFMDTDNEINIDINDDELLKEYQDLEMENTKQELPDVPNHDIVIKDNNNQQKNNIVNNNDQQVIDNDKQVLMN